MVNGKPIYSCTMLALEARGKDIKTAEVLNADGKLDAVPAAFAKYDAQQCGFCTPGFVLMAGQLLKEHPAPDDDEIRHYLSGNLCRCAAYPEIVKAVKLAAAKMRAGRP